MNQEQIDNVHRLHEETGYVLWVVKKALALSDWDYDSALAYLKRLQLH